MGFLQQKKKKQEPVRIDQTVHSYDSRELSVIVMQQSCDTMALEHNLKNE